MQQLKSSSEHDHPGVTGFEVCHLTINGRQVAFRRAGDRPAIVLIYGLASSSATWRLVGPRRAAG